MKKPSSPENLEWSPQEEVEGSEKPKLIIPERYLCALTNKMMKNPVKAHDKFVYEKEVIFDYLQKNRKSPKTGKALNARITVKRSLKPQVGLKKEIETFMEANRELLEMQEEGAGDTSQYQASGETPGGEEVVY